MTKHSLYAGPLAALLLAATGASHAQSPAVSLDVIQKYAPTIYLHPYDNHHPMAVEGFLSESSMLDQSGNVLKSGLTPADLATYSSSTNYLRFTNNTFPSAGNDFETGDPIVAGSSSGWGQSNAPIYVKTIDYGTYIDLKFYMFYAINGFQTFQAGIIVNFKTQPYLFNWGNFALHQGDWEHVTVRISEDTTKLLGVFYSQHGGAQWVANPSPPNPSAMLKQISGLIFLESFGQIRIGLDKNCLMAIGLNGCPDVIDRFDVIVIRAGVWGYVRRERFVVLLDVCEHSHPPRTRRARQ